MQGNRIRSGSEKIRRLESAKHEVLAGSLQGICHHGVFRTVPWAPSTIRPFIAVSLFHPYVKSISRFFDCL